jgi:hypothetical protein
MARNITHASDLKIESVGSLLTNNNGKLRTKEDTPECFQQINEKELRSGSLKNKQNITRSVQLIEKVHTWLKSHICLETVRDY